MKSGTLGSEARLLERGGGFFHQADGLVWQTTGIRKKLTAEPEQSKPDRLNVGGLDGRDDLLGLSGKACKVTRSPA